MKILIAVFILICIAAIVVTSYIMDSTTLSSEETGQVSDSCGNCHSNPDRLKDDNAHRQHQNADCATCHIGASGLEAADNAHDTMEWIGIGIVALTVAGLGLNYTIVRKKLKSR
ncbi:MAG: hypothetical protein GY845_07835 [Planctomycetes bacterium]|nr:hypothetical protein [Planctomycetota bacterium]